MRSKDHNIADQEGEDFVKVITPDVLRVLNKCRFFDKLDDQFAPTLDGQTPVKCSGDYAATRAILAGLKFNDEDQDDIIDVLVSVGGCCDCEILYNVAEESRLKSAYWKARAAGLSQGSGH